MASPAVWFGLPKLGRVGTGLGASTRACCCAGRLGLLRLRGWRERCCSLAVAEPAAWAVAWVSAGPGLGGVGGRGFAHGLELFQRLLIELLRARLRGLGRSAREVFWRVEIGELFVAVFEDVDGVDETRLMEEHTRTVEEEPDDGQVDDDRDVDGLTKAGLGALIVERVE